MDPVQTTITLTSDTVETLILLVNARADRSACLARNDIVGAERAQARLVSLMSDFSQEVAFEVREAQSAMLCAEDDASAA